MKQIMQARVLYCLLILIHAIGLHAVCPSTLAQVSGSPFTGGTQPRYIAYSPVVSGNLFAAMPNATTNNVSVYTVNTSTGVFGTGIAGQPFACGAAPRWVAFSPVVSGNLFAAVTNRTDGTVSVYSVNTSTGVFSQVASSPFTAGAGAYGVAFSPLLGTNLFAAVSNSTANTISVFQVNTSTGFFTLIGTVGTTGTNLLQISFSPLVAGNLFAATANNTTNNVSVYQVNTSTGAFTQVTGSPFSVGTGPFGVTFSPVVNGNLFLATPNQTSNNISVFQVNIASGVLTQVTNSPFSGGTGPTGIAISPLIGSNLFLASTTTTNMILSQLNPVTGALSSGSIVGSPFSTGTSPFGVAFSPLISNTLFAAVGNNGSNNVSAYSFTIPLGVTLTTLSQYIISGNSVTINGTITGGTAPYTVTWQDATQQTPGSSTFSRSVSPTSSTIYYVSNITDANGCSAGPSNTVTVAVRTCP